MEQALALDATRLRRLGEFDLVEEIGRGGMGIVFRGRRVSDGRTVAVKVLPSGIALDREAVERFAREVDATSRVSHPGILPVLGFGEDQGACYFATDLVAGPGLDVVLRELHGRDARLLTRPLADETTLGVACPGARLRAARQDAPYASSCASIAADVASALAAAHAAGVIHRDVKPANVLLDPSGQPRLVDFGLSRNDAHVTLTRSGDAVGTPAYMAPEQVTGNRDLDQRVDVWALGATLYEMLTLRPPFTGTQAATVMRSVLDDEVVPVRRLNPSVPRALEAIVDRCLRKEPAERYSDAGALELDLRAYLTGQRVQARPVATWRRLRTTRLVRPAVLAIVAAIVVVAILAALGAWWRQSAARQGIAHLGRAAAAVRAHDAATAEREYTAARELLRPERVATARVDHLTAALDALDPGIPLPAAFTTLFEALPTEANEVDVRALGARLLGTGRVRFVGFHTPPTLSVRTPAGGWRETEASGGTLPPGTYLATTQATGALSVTVQFAVDRGGEHSVMLPELPSGGGQVFVTDSPVGPCAVWLVDPAVGTADTHALSAAELARARSAGIIDLRAPAPRGRFLPFPDTTEADAAVLAAKAAAVGGFALDLDLMSLAEPGAGVAVWPEAGRWVVRPPRPRAAGAVRLVLPLASGVDDVAPAPTQVSWQGGRRILFWTDGAPSFLRVRVDGQDPTTPGGPVCADAGRIEAGGYANPELGLRIGAAPGLVLRRAAGLRAEAQVEVECVGDAGVGVVVAATALTADGDRGRALARLAAVDPQHERARPVSGTERDLLGRDSWLVHATAQDWVVEFGDGSVRFERRLSVVRDARAYLVRTWARAATEPAARAALRAASSRIATATAAIAIE